MFLFLFGLASAEARNITETFQTLPEKRDDLQEHNRCKSHVLLDYCRRFGRQQRLLLPRMPCRDERELSEVHFQVGTWLNWTLSSSVKVLNDLWSCLIWGLLNGRKIRAEACPQSSPWRVGPRSCTRCRCPDRKFPSRRWSRHNVDTDLQSPRFPISKGQWIGREGIAFNYCKVATGWDKMSSLPVGQESQEARNLGPLSWARLPVLDWNNLLELKETDFCSSLSQCLIWTFKKLDKWVNISQQ
jgi:hypothetical protein